MNFGTVKLRLNRLAEEYVRVTELYLLRRGRRFRLDLFTVSVLPELAKIVLLLGTALYLRFGTLLISCRGYLFTVRISCCILENIL